MRYQSCVCIGLLCAAAGLAQGQVGSLVSELTPTVSFSGQEFGYSVGIDGSYIIVGANFNGFGFPQAPLPIPSDNKIFCYEIDAAGQSSLIWTNDGQTDDVGFGTSVAVSDGVVIAGTRSSQEGNPPDPAVSFFNASDGSLLQRVESDLSINKGFGMAVAIDGTDVAVGARFADRMNITNDSLLYPVGTGFIVDTANSYATVEAPAPMDFYPDRDGFGGSAAVSNGTVVFGTRMDDSKEIFGEAIVYGLNGSLVHRLESDDAPVDDLFGYSVAVSDDGGTVVVGAPTSSVVTTNGGAVYLFDAATGNQIRRITPTIGTTNNYFGHSVAVSGSYIAIGAPGENASGNNGSVYVYDFQGNELVKIDSDGTEFGNPVQFGAEVDISGHYVVAGASSSVFESLGSSGRAYLLDLRCNDADIAEPYGALNFADISLFNMRYAQQDPRADLAGNPDGSPDGNFNFADISAYLALYSAGCN